MVNRGSGSPFDRHPTEFESYLNIVTQAHGQLIINMSQDIELVKQMMQEHSRQHEMANRAVLEMPAVKQDEKPS